MYIYIKSALALGVYDRRGVKKHRCRDQAQRFVFLGPRHSSIVRSIGFSVGRAVEQYQTLIFSVFVPILAEDFWI